MKHTQGTWIALKTSNVHTGFWKIFQNNNYEICDITTNYDGKNNEEKDAEAEANAKLISEAPNLLWDLKCSCSMLETILAIGLNKENIKAAKFQIKQSKQVIKKATE